MYTELYKHQLDAIKKMHNGCILCGGVGSGKSRTSLAYTYICELGGSLNINGNGVWAPPETPKNIYIITTAKKRDTKEWDLEVAYFNLPDTIKVTIDSWNNIKKYDKVYGAMFIFDEQRLVGSGAWVKAFYKITNKNHWILLTATPGDTWTDYIPVMVANGYYKNKTDFNNQHVVYKPYMNYPCIDHFIFTKKLNAIANEIIVKMEYENKVNKHDIDILCDYDKTVYKRVFKERWNPYEDCPIEETGKLCYLLRKVSNSDKSRIDNLISILSSKNIDKVIIFYNFTYELEILRKVAENMNYDVGEWNGEKHTEVPSSERWVYLCQYTAASEGWNCIRTNTIIFYSQNYSYKVMTQASGRIDRLNTPFKDLYYYHFRCNSPIDIAVKRALLLKRNFNEAIFIRNQKI